MKNWWNGLTARERWIVGSGVLLSLILVGYGLIWQPWQRALGDLRQAVANQRRDLAWMQQAVMEVKQLGTAATGAATKPTGAPGQSLLTLVDQSAKKAGLGTVLKRVEPQGSEQLRVQLEGVGFDELIRWLGTLEREYAVRIDTATVDRRSESGRVDARIVLQAGAAS
jgi:general secretion pathway protein M